MKIPSACEAMVLQADGKALATFSVDNEVNVVPVSSVRIVSGEIVLVNYFFGKTLQNIEHNPAVSLACWRGLEGYQIKALARYETEGDLYEEIKAWIKEILPERIVKGIVVLTPKAIFDVSANATRAGKEVVE